MISPVWVFKKDGRILYRWVQDDTPEGRENADKFAGSIGATWEKMTVDEFLALGKP